MALLYGGFGIGVVDSIPTWTPTGDAQARLYRLDGSDLIFFFYNGVSWVEWDFSDLNAVHKTGNESIGGTKTFTSDVIVPDEVYDQAAWNGSLEVPTKNALRDILETIAAGSLPDGDYGAFTVSGGGTVATLNPDVVDNTILNDVTGETLIGRANAVAGDYEEITLDATLEFDTGSLKRADITGDVHITGNISTIQNGAVDIEHIEDISAGEILGRSTAGLGPVETITVTSPLTITGGNLELVDSDIVHISGIETITGAKTFSADVNVPDDAYNATTWNASTEVPTKNAIRDKIESIMTAPLGDGDYGAVTITGGVWTLDPNIDATLIANGSVTDAEFQRLNGVTSDIQTQLDAKANDNDVVHDTGNETVAGIKTFTSDPLIPDEVYDSGAWNGSLEPPTKNAVRDKIETLQPLDTTLTALAAYNTNGIVTQTAADTFVGRTIAGTTNEVDIANGSGVLGNPTISLPATIDLGGKTSLEIPNGAAPTVDADGEIALDTTITDMSHGLIKYFATEECAVIAVPVAELTGMVDGDVIKYNATADEFQISSPLGYVQPLLYKVRATQAGVAAPLVSVANTAANTLGETPLWTRADVGEYAIGTAGTPFSTKTIVTASLENASAADSIKYEVTATNKITLFTYTAGVAADLVGELTVSIEIYS